MENFIFSEQVQTKIQMYVEEDCVLNKAKLLQEIKRITGLCYVDLEGYLYEERRTLIRINRINNLVPCLRQMLKEGKISKIIAYDLATKEPAEQYEYYELLLSYLEIKQNQRKKKYDRKNIKKITVAEFKKLKQTI